MFEFFCEIWLCIFFLHDANGGKRQSCHDVLLHPTKKTLNQREKSLLGACPADHHSFFGVKFQMKQPSYDEGSTGIPWNKRWFHVFFWLKSDLTYNLSSSNQLQSLNFLTRSVWLQPRFRDKNLESRRKEFMRTLIKNPTKLLIHRGEVEAGEEHSGDGHVGWDGPPGGVMFRPP